MKSNRNQGTDGEAKAKPEVIKLGLDLHARQVTDLGAVLYERCLSQ
jgi:hypothetical protein